MSQLPPPSAAPGAWETVVDPEQKFSLAMPRGWQNRAWVKQNGPIPRQVATAASPDGATALFLGDPTIPQFIDPAAVAFAPPPGTVVRPYTPIEHFLPGYLHQRFGRLPGFAPGPMTPSPELARLVGQKLERAGAAQVWVTAARITFSYDDGPRRVGALLLGFSASIGGIWMVDTYGVSTEGDPAPFVPALLEMVASQQATPAMHQRQMQERARSAAQHQATMQSLATNAAILRSNHQQSMANLQGMAASHQAHMADLHAGHDAHNAAWQAQQTTQDAAHAARVQAPDDAHRRFLNLIAEERTVIDGEGHTHQVQDGYDRYFRRRVDGTWIGTKDQRDLRGLPGVNPDDYEEVKIKV